MDYRGARDIGSGTVLREGELEGLNETIDFLKEQMSELELHYEDAGWRKIIAGGERDFSRSGLDDIVRLARVMYLKNPLIQRSVEVKAFYVWGQGVKVSARTPLMQQLITETMADEGNRAELFGGPERTLKEADLGVEGNVFLTLIPSPTTGRLRVRSIPVDEIREKFTNPEDRREVWFYKRVWTRRLIDVETGRESTRSEVSWYPDYRYRRENKPKTIGSNPVNWDAYVMHIRVGGLSSMSFGIPDVYAGLDWAVAHKDFLEDWASITRSLERFAWTLRHKGKARNRVAARERLETTLGPGLDRNPPPTTGAVFIGGDGVELEPIRKTGANVSPEDGRMLRLMVASAVGLPDTILSGDPDMGNLATAKTLDRPTELMMLSRQDLWRQVYQDIFRFAAKQSVAAPSGVLNGSLEVDDALEILKLDSNEDPTTVVDFPPILVPGIDELVKALVSAATLDGKTEAQILPREVLVRELLNALGVQGAEEIIDAMAEASSITVRTTDRVTERLTGVPASVAADESVWLSFIRFEFDTERAEILEALASIDAALAELPHLSPEWRARIEEEALGLISKTLTKGAKAAVKSKGLDLPVGYTFGLGNEEVLAAVRDADFKFARSISDTSEERLRALLLRAQEESLNLADTRKALQKEFGDWSKARAEMVARTEIIRASNAGSHLAYRASGVKKLKWLAASDACPYCLALNGKTVAITKNFLDLGEDFQPPGTSAPLKIRYTEVQHPPAHPHCRCTISPA